MNDCEHLSRQGDNYGISCLACGEQLEGYGYGGFFSSRLTGNEYCIHVWVKINAEREACQYCQAEREREKKAN